MNVACETVEVIQAATVALGILGLLLIIIVCLWKG